jgi:protoporphyrinogen oxidase
LGFHNFEEWIYSTLGSGIAKHFMLPYNEKLWTVSPKELSCEWMGRFVPGTSLEQILDGALSDHSRNIGYNASFGYPLKGGIEALPTSFGNSLKNVHRDLKYQTGSERGGSPLGIANKRTLTSRFLDANAGSHEGGLRVSFRCSKSKRAPRFTSVYNVNLESIGW